MRTVRDGRVVLEARVTWADRSETLWFAWEGVDPDGVDDTSDPFVPATLVPAMAAGERVLEFEGPVSPRLLAAIPRLQEIYCRWHPGYRELEVRAAPRREAAPAPRANAACFFSLGVDSFYTVLQHGPEGGKQPAVDTVLFTRGLERPLESSDHGPEVTALAREAAGERGLRLLVGETNLRTLFPLDWFLVLHGAGLAATALTLAPSLGTILIASGHAWDQVKPGGSSWMSEECYGTERVEVRMDGGDRNRAEKLAWMVDHEIVRRRLRVCTANRAGPGNCGRCPKCVRTMLILALLGRLEDTSAFPAGLPQDLAPYLHGEPELYAREFRWYVDRYPGDAELAARIRRILDDRDRRHHLREWLERSMWAPLLPAVRRVRRLLHRR